MEGIIAVTYRCNARCTMCATWRFPSNAGEEISPRDVEQLPNMRFVNITGGEPFLRKDLDDIVAVAKGKAKRVVISTNGFLRLRILEVMEKHQDVGIRISLDGFLSTHDRVRGTPGAFEKALRTLVDLQMMGIKDLGIGMTISDDNYRDLPHVFAFAERMGLELPINIVHNSYYFHKHDNVIADKEQIKSEIRWAIGKYLQSPRIKNWFRAYFTAGIIDYIDGNPRRLACEAGCNLFVLDPFGEILPCNVLDTSMGNLKKKSFDEIWTGAEARLVRQEVAHCDRGCWMIGSVVAPMRKNMWRPLSWIAENKLRLLAGREVTCTSRF